MKKIFSLALGFLLAAPIASFAVRSGESDHLFVDWLGLGVVISPENIPPAPVASAASSGPAVIEGSFLVSRPLAPAEGKGTGAVALAPAFTSATIGR